MDRNRSYAFLDRLFKPLWHDPALAVVKAHRGDTVAVVIAGAHTIIYAEDAEAARAFFRDVLGFANVDAGGGWLIFALPPGELAAHPGPGRGPGRATSDHELFFMCHDLERTVAELESKGVEFVAPISEEGFGLMTRFKVPGGGEIGLYEPKHASPLAEFSN